MENEVDVWKSQIKRGTLEYCILLMLNNCTCYGYEIITKISQYPIIAAKESTIYPLLRRLLKEEYLISEWKDSKEGLPPRKYYLITDKGRKYLLAMTQEWNNLLYAMDQLKGEL